MVDWTVVVTLVCYVLFPALCIGAVIVRIWRRL